MSKSEIETLRAELIRVRAELAAATAPKRGGRRAGEGDRGSTARNFPFKRPLDEDAAWRRQAAAEGFRGKRDLSKWMRMVLDEAAHVEPRATEPAPPLPTAYGAPDTTIRLTDEERLRYEDARETGQFSSLAHWIRTRLNARCAKS